MISLVRTTLILLAIIASPFYALWVFGGWRMDKRGQNRFHRIRT